MMSLSVLLTTLVALNTIPGGQAQSVTDVTNDNEREYLNRDEVARSFAKTNATLSDKQNVTGYDVTRDWPSREVDGWTLSLSVIGNMPLYESRYLSATQFNYTAPARFRNSSSDGWGLCGHFSYVEYDTNAEVDAGCRGVISDECRDALRERVMEKGELCLPDRMLPSECEDELVGDDSENRLQLLSVSEVSSVTTLLGGKLHEPGEYEYYDKMITRVFVTAIGFFEWRPSEGGEGWAGMVEDGERLPGFLSCVRADKIDGDARSLEEAVKAVEEGSSSRIGAPMALAALAATVAVMGLV